MDKLDITDSRTVIEKLKMQFSQHGIPEVVISDNGPQYASTCTEFAKFASDWHFQHITFSPWHLQSNGKVESAVKICENIMRKAVHGKFDPYLALLDHRNKPTEIGSSQCKGCSAGEHAIYYRCQVDNYSPSSFPHRMCKKG